jgi:hypothetical protein
MWVGWLVARRQDAAVVKLRMTDDDGQPNTIEHEQEELGMRK